MASDRARVAKMANREKLDKAGKKRFDSDGNELVRALVYRNFIGPKGAWRFRKAFRWVLKASVKV